MKNFKNVTKSEPAADTQDEDKTYLDRRTDAVGRRVEVDYPGNRYHGERAEVQSSNEDGTFHSVRFDDGKTAHYHGSDLRFARDSDDDHIKESTSVESMIEDHLKQYHLHNMAWIVNSKLGDFELADNHMRKAMDHHSSALALAKHHEHEIVEPFSVKKKRLKNHVHETVKNDLL